MGGPSCRFLRLARAVPSMTKARGQNVFHKQRHSDWWDSREGHGRAFLRGVASLLDVEIPTEPLKVGTEVCGIFPRVISPLDWFVVGGCL